MLDVALISLIQDMSEKAGIEGTIQYWTRVGESLAKRMGKEAYMGWPSFNVALREGRTAFAIEGDVSALTDLAITDEDGDVVGLRLRVGTVRIGRRQRHRIRTRIGVLV